MIDQRDRKVDSVAARSFPSALFLFHGVPGIALCQEPVRHRRVLALSHALVTHLRPFEYLRLRREDIEPVHTHRIEHPVRDFLRPEELPGDARCSTPRQHPAS
jgi:hypothetical protein